MATPDRNSYADVWDQLDGKWAERVRVTDAALLGDEEIVRRWPQIGEGYLSKCMTALSLFTDAKNNRAQLWVKDPVVGRETFPGVYRMVTVDVDVGKPGMKGIIQTLRKGFATTAQWTEARVLEKIAAQSNTEAVAGISNTTSDVADRELRVLFPNCSPFSIEAIAEALRTGDFSGGVTVKKESHAGVWHVISVSTKTEDDGSASAVLRIATPQYTINGYEDYGTDRAQDVHYVMDVPKDLAQGIVTAWKAAHPVGSSATITYSRDQKLVDVILRRAAVTEAKFVLGAMAVDCRSGDTETIWLNCSTSETYPTVDTLHPIPTVTAGAGVSYVRRVQRNPNGTWDISLKTITAKYRDVTGLTAEVSGDRVVTQRQQLGVTNQTVDSMAEAAGVIKTQRTEVRDDCSRDVVTNSDTGTAQTSTAKTVAGNETETVTQKTVQAAAEALPSSQTAGTIREVRNVPSKYPQKFDTLVREIVAIEYTSGWISYADRTGTSYVLVFKNKAASYIDTVKGAFTADTNNSLSFTKNANGTFDGQASRTAISGGGGGSVDDDVEIDYTITIGDRTFNIDEKITGSLTRAKAHVEGGAAHALGSGKSPGIIYLGKGKYKATRVEASA